MACSILSSPSACLHGEQYADRAPSTFRTVPTEDQILVPETLLKKRKSQEKAREDRLAEQKKRKAVRDTPEKQVSFQSSEFGL